MKVNPGERKQTRRCAFGRRDLSPGLFFGLAMLHSMAVPRSAEIPETNAPIVMKKVVVVGRTNSLAPPSITGAAELKRAVPGGFTLRDSQTLERGHASGFQDLLARVPGLTLQTENGLEVSEVSIRGSGVLSDDEPVGVEFLLDGFPFNQGDGEVILEDFDLGSIQYAEVFRGATAFKYGSTTLGGAINLASRTGYSDGPLQIRLEGGSYGFARGQIGSGGVEGSMDYFVSLTGRRREGYRRHSSENTEDMTGNLGWRISDGLENRFYLTLARTDRKLPGGLTKDQLEQDPKQADPDAIAQDLGKAWTYLRLADKVTYSNGGEQLDIGAYWWHRDLLSRALFEPDSPEGIQAFYSDNFGLVMDSVTRSEWFGRDNILTVGFAPTAEREVDQNFQNLSGQRGDTTARDSELSINAPLYAEDQQYLTEKLSVIFGLQAIYSQRHFRDYFNATPSGDQSGNGVFRGLNPKVGAIYEFDRQNQLFANFSRSWQPPSFDNMVDFGEDPGESLEFTPLRPQRAWTVETGVRGERGRASWELALYHAWVCNELLDVNNSQGVDRGAVNIDRSYHQGIEAGLEFELLDSLLAKGNQDSRADRLTWEQSYTLNDLHFDHDPVYGNNRIAAIPIHLYEAALTYEHPSGFYAGPNLRWNITKYPVDHANTLFADPYALLGFRVGYRSKKGFSVFVEAKNLCNQRYASDVDPVPDARSAAGPARIFHPGDGRSFYGGVSWSW